MSRTSTVAVAALAVVYLTSPPDAAARSGYGWTVGSAGWSLEQFGPNVTVLRSQPSSAPSREPILFLSCSFGTTRLRITFPERLPGRLPEDGPGGIALVRPRASDAASARGMVARFETPGFQQLEFRGGPESGVVSAIVRMLQARRGEIEMLIGFGAMPPQVGGRLVAYSFAPVFGSGDDPMLAHVASACVSREKPLHK